MYVDILLETAWELVLSWQEVFTGSAGGVTKVCSSTALMMMMTMQNSEKIWTYSSTRSSKVDDFYTNRKPTCNFLLVINGNFSSILNCLWDMAIYWLKIAYFFPLCHLAPLLPMFPLEFRSEINHEETRVMGLLCGDSCVILTVTISDWSTRVTDRRMDER